MIEQDQTSTSNFNGMVDASNLAGLVSLLNQVTGSDKFGPHLLQIEFVVDVDAVIQTLIRKCRNPNFVSSFEELKASGIVIFHLPHWGITEIEDSALRQVSEKRGIHLDVLLQQWKHLQHCFTIHEGYSFPHVKSWDVKHKDWKDEPYAALHQDIGTEAVLSSNTEDMLELGAEVLPPSVLKDIIEYARSETACVMIKVGSVSVASISFQGIEAAVESMPPLWAKTPVGLKWGILGIGVAALAYGPSRRKIFSCAKTGGAVALELCSLLLDEYYENQKAAETFKKARI